MTGLPPLPVFLWSVVSVLRARWRTVTALLVVQGILAFLGVVVLGLLAASMGLSDGVIYGIPAWLAGAWFTGACLEALGGHETGEAVLSGSRTWMVLLAVTAPFGLAAVIPGAALLGLVLLARFPFAAVLAACDHRGVIESFRESGPLAAGMRTGIFLRLFALDVLASAPAAVMGRLTTFYLLGMFIGMLLAPVVLAGTAVLYVAACRIKEQHPVLTLDEAG